MARVARLIEVGCMFAERSTPVGRVMNRFSGDINIIDEVLPGVLQSFINCAFQVRLLPYDSIIRIPTKSARLSAHV